MPSICYHGCHLKRDMILFQRHWPTRLMRAIRTITLPAVRAHFPLIRWAPRTGQNAFSSGNPKLDGISHNFLECGAMSQQKIKASSLRNGVGIYSPHRWLHPLVRGGSQLGAKHREKPTGAEVTKPSCHPNLSNNAFLKRKNSWSRSWNLSLYTFSQTYQQSRQVWIWNGPAPLTMGRMLLRKVEGGRYAGPSSPPDSRRRTLNSAPW